VYRHNGRGAESANEKVSKAHCVFPFIYGMVNRLQAGTFFAWPLPSLGS
jgi:hypothetical protein